MFSLAVYVYCRFTLLFVLCHKIQNRKERKCFKFCFKIDKKKSREYTTMNACVTHISFRDGVRKMVNARVLSTGFQKQSEKSIGIGCKCFSVRLLADE